MTAMDCTVHKARTTLVLATTAIRLLLLQRTTEQTVQIVTDYTARMVPTISLEESIVLRL